MRTRHDSLASGVEMRFEPIVDVYLASVLGYVVVAADARGSADRIRLVRDSAREGGSLVMHERAWRREALERAVAAHVDPEALLMVDVDPRVLDDPAFRPGSTRELLAEFGFQAERFVVRLPVPSAPDETLRVKALARHFSSQGFPVALDGVDGGIASVLAVEKLNPDVLMLNAALVQGMAADPLRRDLVSSFARSCATTGKLLVANGVDNWGDLACAARASVRFGRGFVLGVGTPSPEPIDGGTRGLLSRLGCPTGTDCASEPAGVTPAGAGGRAA